MPNRTHHRVVIIVQARVSSTRLPGKIFKEVLGRPLLDYVIERLRRVSLADNIVIATTTNPKDQEVVSFCCNASYDLFRGSEDDVLKRYAEAARAFDADIIVRICSDCPLIDPAIIDAAIQLYHAKAPNVDYVSNTLNRTYPRGMDVEVFSLKTLLEAEQKAVKSEEREHVTPYIWSHPDLYKLAQTTQKNNESHHRWTVDTEEDFTLIKKILESVYPLNPAFTKDQVIDLLKHHPDWFYINQHIKQKPIGIS